MKNKANYKIISDEAFHYTSYNGVLKVFKGTVLCPNSSNVGSFCVKKGDDYAVKMLCHLEPGKIYNASVWLPERDDEEAKRLLIQYHEEAIETLKIKIEGHLSKIKLIKEADIVNLY